MAGLRALSLLRSLWDVKEPTLLFVKCRWQLGPGSLVGVNIETSSVLTCNALIAVADPHQPSLKPPD